MVVTSDIAVQNERFKFTCGGAATAMLFGPNAPMRFDPRRASYISDEHDFYKPVGWHELAPVVDMRVATDTYMRALRGCLQSYTTNHRIDKTSLIDTHDYFVFHMNSRYHAHMAFQTMCNFCWDREDVTKEEIQGLFDAKVLASTEVCRRTGSNYTSSVYCGLLSLTALAGNAGLKNKRVLVYSYGSGCAASIYALDTKGSPIVGPVFGRLDDRERVSPQEIDGCSRKRKKSHMRFGFADIK